MQILAGLTWDPQLRGALILLTGVLILPGSVYLLLLTNLGAKVGFLIAAAGVSGLLLMLNIVWLIAPLGNGPIGYKGGAPTWVVKEIVTGDLAAHSATKAVVGVPGTHNQQFPAGWKLLKTGDPTLAQAGPFADKALIPPPPGGSQTSAFPPPFQTTQDYVMVSAWTKGGHNYLVNLFGYKIYWRIRHHQIYIKHQPHYLVIRVQPSLPTITLEGAAQTLPAADASKPITSVVMLRKVGSLRKPPIVVGTAALLVFLLDLEYLHHRDKEITRRKEEGEGEASRSRELQPA